MFHYNTDLEWQKFGDRDPYFAVLTDKSYQTHNLNEQTKEEFFQTGYHYVFHILTKIREHLNPHYIPRQALDFGCGVGRLVIPLAEIAASVTGVDISEAMLHEARKNCQERRINNVCFLTSDDNLSLLPYQYDFIHSFIVFQHLPVKRGEYLFQRLIDHLADEGIAVIHFTYARDQMSYKRKLFFLISQIKKYIPFAKRGINLIRGRNIFAPDMQMNVYNLNYLFYIIQKNHIQNCYIEYTNHGGELGVLIYFQKPKTE